MQAVITIPDDLAQHYLSNGQDPSRAALEALALEGYRTQQLNEPQVRRMLGFGTRMQVHAWLAQHEVCLQYSADLLKLDIEASDKLHNQRVSNNNRAA